MIKKSSCDACGAGDITTIYDLPRIPAFQNRLFTSASEARQAPVARVSLAACAVCGFVFNSLFDDSIMDYDGDYQNAQDHSPSFQSYLDGIADLILQRIDPKGKVVEIGCGKGFFLQVLKSRGVNVTGFDPAYEGDSPDIVKAYFDAKAVGGLDVDALVMRHTLEHIESPYTFLLNLKSILKKDATIFIEVPRLEWIVEHKAFWDIFHEHCNYFSEDFFQGIFSGKAEIHKVFDDQYMLVKAQMSDLTPQPAARPQPAYRDIFTSEISKYDGLIAQCKRSYVWGAGAKGIAFVNILDPDCKRVEALIDINPKKQNHFVSLTGHACIAPEAVQWAELGEKDCLWIMNGRYKDEILNSLPSLACKVVVLGDS